MNSKPSAHSLAAQQRKSSRNHLSTGNFFNNLLPPQVTQGTHAMLYNLESLNVNAAPNFWCETVSGKPFNLIDPDATDNNLTLTDIIIPLTKEPRYGGHTKHPNEVYSVAAHHLFCWALGQKLFPEKEDDDDFMLGLLLHDAHEFILKDIPSPVKQALSFISHSTEHTYEFDSPLNNPYKTLCEHIQERIYSKFEISIDDESHWQIKYCDRVALLMESFFFMESKGLNWTVNQNFITEDKFSIFRDLLNDGSHAKFVNVAPLYFTDRKHEEKLLNELKLLYESFSNTLKFPVHVFGLDDARRQQNFYSKALGSYIS